MGGVTAVPTALAIELDQPMIEQDALDIVASLVETPEVDVGIVEPLITEDGVTIELAPTSTVTAHLDPVISLNPSPVLDSLLDNQPHLI